MFPVPMDFSVEVMIEMKVNRNCDLCQAKVTEIMYSLTACYTTNFVGDNNTTKVTGIANPNRISAVIDKYGDHGKVVNLSLDGREITPHPGGLYFPQSQSGYYPPTNGPAAYPYLPPYAPYPQYSMPNPPPPQKEAPPRVGLKQHTAAPFYAIEPPPPLALSSYSYIEPPYWPTSSSSGFKCVIM